MAANNNITEWDALSALDVIYTKSNHVKLDDKFFKSISEPAKYLNTIYGLTPMQSLFIALGIEKGNVSMYDLASRVKANRLKLIVYEKEITELRQRKIMKRINSQFGHFFVTKPFLDALKANVPYTIKQYTEYTSTDVLKDAGAYINEIYHNYDLRDENTNEILYLLSRTSHTQLSLYLKNFTDRARIVFLTIVWSRYDKNAEQFFINDLKPVLDDDDYEEMVNKLQSEDSTFIKDEIFEFDNDNGLADNEVLRLTDKALNTCLSDIKFHIGHEKLKCTDVIEPDELPRKELFYNHEEEHLVNRLSSLLDKDNFSKLQNRLREANMPVGFTCLFYGLPGTGKTETALQLSRTTGRAVLQLDMSEIRSKWVGESEKNIKSIFKRYNQLVKNSKICPILLFNEADAIMGRRFTNLSSSVEQMENTIQNIILQEMEHFEGILIATTNLTTNFDGAFNRRFLFKIQFELPSLEVKAKIWQNMLPDISSQDSLTLAEKYDFSGGQINNVARKRTIDKVLFDTGDDIESIFSLCEEERIKGEANSRKIGF